MVCADARGLSVQAARVSLRYAGLADRTGGTGGTEVTRRGGGSRGGRGACGDRAGAAQKTGRKPLRPRLP